MRFELLYTPVGHTAVAKRLRAPSALGVRTAALASLACLLLSGCTTAWISALIDEQERKEALRPTQHQPAVTGPIKPLLPVRVRVYADASFRALYVDWQAEARRQSDAANAWFEPLGGQFIIVGMQAWDLPHVEDLDAALTALRDLDPAEDADWVLGMVGALPRYSDSMQELGRAFVPGMHAVIRAIDDRIDLEVMQRSLQMTTGAEVERIYEARRRHKNAVQWIHEWAHGVGANHTPGRPTSFMSPQYRSEMARFEWIDEQLVTAALELRSGTTRDEAAWAERAAKVLQDARKLDPEQSDTLARIVAVRDAHRAMMTDTPSAPATPTAAVARAPLQVAKDPWKELPADDFRRLQQANRVWNQGDPAKAWRELAPVRDRHRDHPALQVMACELAGVAQHPEAADVCAVARLVAPRDPRPAMVLMQKPAAQGETLDPVLLQAACEAELLAYEASAARLGYLAQLAASQGAFACAERALLSAPEGDQRKAAAARVRQLRNMWGVPEGASPANEIELGLGMRAVEIALQGGKLDAAAAEAVALVERHPSSATWALLSEVRGHQRRYADARKLAAQAIEAFPSNARARYVLAVLALHGNELDDADLHLRRIIAEAPQHAGAYPLLANVLQREGRTAELAALREKYQAQFKQRPTF